MNRIFVLLKTLGLLRHLSIVCFAAQLTTGMYTYVYYSRSG